MVLKLRLLFTAGRVGVVPALPLFLRIADGEGISMPRLLRFSGSAGRPGAVGLVLTFPPAPFMSVSQARVLSSTFSSFRYSLNTWLPCAPDPATWVNNRDIFSIVASKWVMESTSSSDDESSKLSDCLFLPDSKTPMIRSMLRRMLANTRVRGSTTSLFVTRVNSALTRTSSKTTNSVRPMLRNAVHLLTSRISSSVTTHAPPVLLTSPPQSPLASTRWSELRPDRGKVPDQSHVRLPNVSATGFRSDPAKKSKNPLATDSVIRESPTPTTSATAVMESWYAAGMVSLSFHASKGAAKTVRMTITATFLETASRRSRAMRLDDIASPPLSSLSLEDPFVYLLSAFSACGRNSRNDLNLRTH